MVLICIHNRIFETRERQGWSIVSSSQNNTGKPIVSTNDHQTETISEFVDFHLRSHVENLLSHIQDTTDYL